MKEPNHCTSAVSSVATENGETVSIYVDHHHPLLQLKSNIARAYAALGKAGIEEVNALVLHVAKDFGFTDPSRLSSDTTAQELPIGYPNEPGILRGVAQRCGRALAKLKQCGVQGVEAAIEQVETILKTVKEHHVFTKGKAEKRQVLVRLLTEVGQLLVYDRGGGVTPTMDHVAREGGQQAGIQPKGKRPWRIAEAVRDVVRSERGKTEGIIGTLKSDTYKFNNPKERLWQTLEMAGPRSILSFNLNKLMRDLVQAGT